MEWINPRDTYLADTFGCIENCNEDSTDLQYTSSVIEADSAI